MLTYPKPLHYLKPFPEEELKKISGIAWLSQLGSPDRIENAVAVPERDKAVSMAMATDWADFRLEMRNEVTGFLASRHSQNYTEWNNSARGLRTYFDATIAPSIEEKISELGLPNDLMKDIGWDIVTALQETAFSQFRIPRFHHRLLAIYEQGHLPCGISPLDLNDPKPNGTIQYL